MEGLNALFASRRFWVAVLDVLISTATIIVGRYGGEQDVSFLLTLVGIYQPLFLVVIAAFTVEDTKAMQLAHDAEMEQQQRLYDGRREESRQAQEIALAELRFAELREIVAVAQGKA